MARLFAHAALLPLALLLGQLLLPLASADPDPSE